ncbi:MAG: RHS repeat-associated core domain-containing protein, partial [Verrucomicrobia bacterium]|nr:RHS repeat-associated core domain-containing protein [Verrucomicrobiota bacterium]
MRYLLIFFLLLSQLIFSSNTVAVTENDPNTLVEGVSVITGDLFKERQDMVIAGVEPLCLSRSYISQKGEGYWNFFPYHQVFMDWDAKLLEIVEPSGAILLYEGTKSEADLEEEKKHEGTGYGEWIKSGGHLTFSLKQSSTQGMTNTGRGALSGLYNLKNQRIQLSTDRKHLVVFCPDGTRRFYRKNSDPYHINDVSKILLPKESTLLEKITDTFLLKEEVLPNGNKILYEWPKKKGETWMIKTCNPSKRIVYAWAKFYPKNKEKDRDHGDYGLETSDGHRFEYFTFSYQEQDQLKKVYSNRFPEETIHYLSYKDKKILNAFTYPGNRSVHYSYYLPGDYNNNVKVRKGDEVCFRVKEIIFPVQEDGWQVAIHTFVYDIPARKTTVLNAYKTPTVYHYDENLRLIQINKYLENNVLYHQTRFIWGQKDSKEETNLLCKILFDDKERPIQAIRYLYDPYGNVIAEKLYGNLTGEGLPFTLSKEGFPEGGEVYTKKFSYGADGKHLLYSKEEDNGAKVIYTYHNDTPLLKEEHYYDQSALCYTKTYKYDGNNNLMEARIEDHRGNLFRKTMYGLKNEHTPYPGMPKIIEDWAGESLLKKVELEYTTFGQIAKKTISDAERSIKYDLIYDYKRGLLTKEVNAIGEEAYSEYDDLNNKIIHKPFGGRSTLTFGYDLAGNLRWEVESDGCTTKDRNYKYNHLLQKTDSWDEYKNHTAYKYDTAGNLLNTFLPNGGVTTSTYSSAGCPITHTDARGHTVITTYNIYNKPTQILYPNGSFESFSYYPCGDLKTHTDQNGLITSYEYDAFHRVLEKSCSEKKESFTYDSFNLTSKKDSVGYTTFYEYDQAGRKIRENLENQIITYEYDTLGRLHKTTQGNLVSLSVYDDLDRLTEERKEDIQGNLYHKISYGYDVSGNLASTTKYINNVEATETIDYDAFNRIKVKKDALGFETNYFYELLPHRTTVVDPMGLQTIETFNNQNKVELLEKISSSGKTLLTQLYHYDLQGNMECQESIFDGCTQKVYKEYDGMNRVKKLTEAADSEYQKVTCYTYTPTGNLKVVTKPSGITLTYDYDLLDHPKSLLSSDGTINYLYSYDTRGSLLRSENKNTKEILTRSYDAHKNLERETFPTEFFIKNIYDKQNRRTLLFLPGGNNISYDYGAFYLNSVSRYCQSSMLYSHKYIERDLSGSLLQEELALNKGTVTYDYDPLQRCILIDSPYFSQKALLFDRVGNLLSTKRQGESLTYTYDDLYQLTSEKDHTYAFDALYNRRKKDDVFFTANLLNQTSELSYNVDGNPKFLDGKKLTYDALDRLILIEEAIRQIRYSYDSLHRRLSKKTYTPIGDTWALTEEIFYLYDGLNEIGSYDLSGTLLELRVLGETPHAEIGASIAIEIQDKTYIPSHDLHGNVSALCSSDDILENYSYTAFGEELFSPPSSQNPWRFSSKRTDNETGLVYYGRRYYTPKIGRFLTPDPLGLEAGPNLYAFVLNDPLTHFDLYGLEEESWLSHPRVQGSLQMLGGLAQAGVGAKLTFMTGGAAGVLAWSLLANGLDHVITGGYSMI